MATRKSAAGLAGAAAANLTMLVPASVLAIAFAFLVVRSWRPAESLDRKAKKAARKAAVKTTPGGELLYFFGPLGLLGLAFLVMAPIESAGMQNFYAGTESVTACVRDLAEVSFAYDGRFLGLLLSTPLFNAWLGCVIVLLFGVVLTGVMVAIHLILAKKVPNSTPAEIAVLLTAPAIAMAACLLVLAHLATGLPTPWIELGCTSFLSRCCALPR